MAQDKLTIRIALNKPAPEDEPAKEKPYRQALIAAILLSPMVALGLYHSLFKQEIITNSISEPPQPLAMQAPTEIEPVPFAPQAAQLTISKANKVKEIVTPPPSITLPDVKATTKPHKKASSAPRQETKTETAQQFATTLPAFLKRAQFSTGISQREPQDTIHDQVTLTELPENRLYLFTEVRGKAGQVIHHRWIYKNRVMADIPIKIGSDRWRCYTSKRLNENLLGKWQIEITDDQLNVLYSNSVQVSS